MATYNVTGPDGKKYKVTGPPGASKEQVLSQVQAYSAPTAEPPPPTEEDTSDWGDRVGAVAQGVSFGFSDEAEAAAKTAWSKLRGETDKGWKDTWAELRAAEKADRENYKKFHPKEALALEIGGGFLTGGAGATRVAGMRGLSAARKGLLLATGQGALAGAGMSEGGLEERAIGAGVGGLFGVGTKLGLDAVAGAGRGLVNRRVSQELGKGDDFVPLNIADPEGVLGKSYKDIVGKAFGSRVTDQTEAVIDRTRGQLHSTIREGEGLAKAANAVRARTQEGTSRLIRATSRSAKENINIATENAVKTSDDQAAASIRAIEGGAGFGDKMNTEQFRQQAIASAKPPWSTVDIDGLDPQAAIRSLEQSWRSGFQVVKGRDFDIYADDIVKDALGSINRGGLDDYTTSIAALLDDKLLGKATASVPVPGKPHIRTKGTRLKQTISGEDLMEARNALRREANSGVDSGKSAVRIEAMRRAAKTIDDEIVDQLGDKAPIYKQELDAWGNYQDLRDASRLKAPKGQGMFDEADWISVKSRGADRATTAGRATLQQEGMGLQRTRDALQEQARDKIDDVNVNKDAANQALKRKKRTDNTKVDVAREKSTGLVRATNRGKAKPEDMSPGYAAAKEAEKSLEGQKPNLDNLWQRAFATAALPVVGGLSSGPVGVGAGILGASQASRPSVQRALAGQTDVQKLLAELLRKYEGSAAQKGAAATSSSLRRAGVGGLVSE